MVAARDLKKTGITKKMSVSGQMNNDPYEVFAIPLEYLYYNDQNGRINTTYKQYQAEHGVLIPEAGNSKYNEIFEDFIYKSNANALKDTLQSIKDKTQQEPGVVLPDGRVIDGNRRFTALRMYQSEDNIAKTFEAIILPLDAAKKTDEKTIKELELDLQLGREERINYDPIDRIFDVYNTIKVEELMTVEEYKKASGAGNTKGINRDIRLAELILRFIGIISPGGEPVNKFFLARDLKLDGPIEEIESTINKLKSSDKEAITDAVLVQLAVAKTNNENQDATRIIRDLKDNVLKKSDILEHYMDAVDDKVDDIIDAFKEKPIMSSNDLKQTINQDSELKEVVEKFKQSTNRLVHKGMKDKKRTRVISELEDIMDNLDEISVDSFSDLTVEENLNAKDLLRDITDILYKLKKDLKV